MRNTPIGVFDSGLGGLSVLHALVEKLPHENFIYIADQAYTPYGKRSKEEIITRSERLTEWLVKQHCKLIVVACNTATTNAISQLRKNFPIPFVGIEPAIKPAALGSKTGVVGVLATQGTLTSELFQNTANNHAKDIQVITQVGKGLVELVEAGKANSLEAEIQLKNDLKLMLKHPIDHLVLGCTHYPFLKPVLKRVLPHSVQIVDCSDAVARQTEQVLNDNRLNDSSGRSIHYYSTAPPDKKLWNSFGVEHVEIVRI